MFAFSDSFGRLFPETKIARGLNLTIKELEKEQDDFKNIEFIVDR